MIALGVAARWLHLAAGLGLVGLVTATLLVGHRDRPTVLAWEARMLGWARALTGLVLATGLATLAHQSAVVTGRPGAALEIGEWTRLLGHSQFGTVWLVRHGVLLLLAALLLLREREESVADRLALRRSPRCCGSPRARRARTRGPSRCSRCGRSRAWPSPS